MRYKWISLPLSLSSSFSASLSRHAVSHGWPNDDAIIVLDILGGARLFAVSVEWPGRQTFAERTRVLSARLSRLLGNLWGNFISAKRNASLDRASNTSSTILQTGTPAPSRTRRRMLEEAIGNPYALSLCPYCHLGRVGFLQLLTTSLL